MSRLQTFKNVKIIENNVRLTLARRGHPEIRNSIQRNFYSKRTKMLAEFLNLPVSVEINAGPYSPNSSGLLGGYGNLFSFIGFNNSDDPIAPILELLESTDIKFTNVTKKGIVYKVFLPSAETIFGVTPMPWASGRSWAQGIEQGISGLGWYLYGKANYRTSRSGPAIQTQGDEKIGLGGGKFQNTKYISAFINKWEREFRAL